ncbi:MFS transporter [Bifidobacterium olomucense]|uniref:MFS transporter n=1 Tax=Bifidobacterium olomucense TaxID=2675324 RepID=A0A7Y0EYF2_9BIFI|nr:MFS transporter [Bifidobacterium sp. DSM 109959]NMM98706.1 MFS transporter [Bifidobacterium sp. DSM 109959]
MKSDSLPMQYEEDAPSQITLPMLHMIRFLAGFFICGLLWVTAFNSASMVLLPQRLKDDGFANPNGLIAQLNAAGAVVALCANIIFGSLSDRSRSRFGRRTPFMIAGAIASGTCLFLVSVAQHAATIIAAWCGLQLFLNALLSPALATLSDRIPGNLRVRMSVAYGLGITMGNAFGTMLGALFHERKTIGFAVAACLLALDGLIVVSIWPKEPSAENLPKAGNGVKAMLKSFQPPIRGASDFYKALIGRFCLMLAYNMVFAYQLYILESYLGQNAKQAAATIAVLSSCTMIASLTGMIVSGVIAERWGRRKPLLIIAAVLLACGFLAPRLMPSVQGFYIYGVLAGLGYGTYNASNQALSIDVLPNKNEAGKGLGILNLANTSGMILAAVITSSVYAICGTYRPVFIGAALLALISIPCIATIRSAR